MKNKATIMMHDAIAGTLWQDEGGYYFQYDHTYLYSPNAEPVSLTLPLQEKVFMYRMLFPFFDGLIPEGWMLEIAEKNWKLNSRDRFELLLVCCRDCIGAVSVVPYKKAKL
jgi:serine/threonine-protein kinase HipA